MLYLKDTPINQILSMNEMIEAIEDTLKEVAARPRLRVAAAAGFIIPIG